jgi:S-phase kinase-associated protein 1
VAEYCTHHAADEPNDDAEGKRTRKESAPESAWETQFFAVDHATLLALVLAANYLEIQVLLTAAIKKVASIYNKMTPEEIRKWYGHPEPYSEQEEASMRAAFPWYKN